MILAFFLLSLASFATAWAVAVRANGEWDKETKGLPLLEGITCFFLLWIGVTWTLATLRWLRPAGFLAMASFLGISATCIFYRNRQSLKMVLTGSAQTLRSLRIEWLPLGILTVLVVFNLFKGWILPCANTDALAWSMPIAIHYHLSHGLKWIAAPQAEWMGHLSAPHTYEMLVASVLSTTGTDRITEWISTVAACGILCTVGVYFRRWHGSGAHVWTALFVFASAPVFLLHMAADKADLLTTLFILLGVFWTARAWLGTSLRPGIFAIWVIFALFNTKRSGWMIAPPLLLAIFTRWMFLARIGHQRWGSTILKAAGHSLGGFLAMGGIKSLWLWIHSPNLSTTAAEIASLANPSAHHFSWLDPLRFLWVVSLAPFRSTDYTVRLLSGVEWYWPQYNLIYSHYGACFGLALLLALGVLIARLFRRGPALRFPREQWYCLTISILLAFLLLVRTYAYDGGFNTFPRFVLFLLPALISAGLLPLLAAARRNKIQILFLAISALILTGASLGAYANDMTAPFEFLSELSKDPAKRRIPFVGPNRYPCRLDRVASPRAAIAADCTFQTWLAPLWGEGFTRRVDLIAWENDRPSIPADTEWVVADNVSGITWGHGHETRTAEEFGKAWNRGRPSARDTLLFRILKDDPEWECLLATPQGEQALFYRRMTSKVTLLPKN